MLKRNTPLQRGGPIERRSRLSPVSKRRAPQLREYSKARRRFLADHPVCEVWLAENNWSRIRVGPMGVAWYSRTRNEGVQVTEVSAEVLVNNWRAPRSVDVHHKRGRVGLMLLAEEHWMAVSRRAHDWIHANPRLAREKGWLA